ncbi:MAG: O-antigen ligase family protein [Candidatus Omnitrophota bacterium]
MPLRKIPLRQILFLGVMFLIIALRLGIWKLFPNMEFSVKDEFSNMIIAGAVFALAAVFFSTRLIRREGLVHSGLEGPMALFIMTAAVSAGWSADVSSTCRALIVLAAYVLFFYMLVEILKETVLRQAFFWFFTAAAVIVALFGINDIIYLNSVPAQEIENARLTNESLYYILIHKRACSLFGWPNVLASFLMLSMPLAAGLVLVVRHWAWKAVGVISLGLMLTAFFFTYSVLGWSVFLFTAMVMFLILWRSGFLKIPPVWSRWIGVGVVLVGVLFAMVLIRKDFKASITPRQEYVRVVGSMIAQDPWRGCGYGAYRYASLKFVTNHAAMTGFAHNAYLQVWAENGLGGFIAFCWMVVLLVMGSFRAWLIPRPVDGKIMLAVVLWGLLAFFIDNLNSFTMIKPNSSFFFWTWLAVACSMIFPTRETPGACSRVSRWLMVILVLASLAGFWMAGRWAGYMFWLQKGMNAVNAGDWTAGRTALARARAFDPEDVRAWTVLGMSYLKEFQATQKKADLDKAQAAFERAAVLAPNFYHSFLILSRIHAFKGSQDLAVRLQQKAMSVSPYEVQRDLKQMQGGQR